mgnify:FL=1
MINTIKKLFRKEEAYEQKLERYMELHFAMISKNNGATMNANILAHAVGALKSGYTPEEAIMRSILFDITLHAEENGTSPVKMMPLLRASTDKLKQLAKWRAEGKISKQVYNEDAPNYYRVCSLQSGQQEALDAVLHDLRNPMIAG